MKYLAQICICLALLSCNTTKKIAVDKMEGKYLWQSLHGVGETIELNSDSTFVFSWTQGLLKGTTHGKIELSNNQLKVYSDIDRADAKYELEIPPQTKQDYYSIMVAVEDWNRFIGATCEAYSNGKLVQGQSTNEMGICRIDSLEIDALIIEYLGYQHADISVVKYETPKSLIVKLKPENHYHYFEGEQLRFINRNTIQLETFGRIKTFKRILAK